MLLTKLRLKNRLHLGLFFVAITFLALIYVKTTSDNLPAVEDEAEYILLDGFQSQEGVKPQNTLEQKLYPDLKNCTNKKPFTQFVPKDSYWVLENYIQGTKDFGCDKTITFATHADASTLHHLPNITARWQGPVSVTVYDTGKNFEDTLRTFLHMRKCLSSNVKQYVTFHVLFRVNSFPKKIPTEYEFPKYEIPCNNDTFGGKMQKNSQMYPMAFARNIAKSLSRTYFILSSDIQLYPSVNIINDFFKMLQQPPDNSNSTKKKAFVVPAFEVKKYELPKTKSELESLIKNKKALAADSHTCKRCNISSNFDVWSNSNNYNQSGSTKLDIRARQMPPMHWEPLFIGRAKEQILDNSLIPYEEPVAAKLIQAYVTCLMDYEYQVLDNAFLVYHPDAFEERVLNLPKSNPESIRKIMTEYKKRHEKKEKCDRFFKNLNARYLNEEKSS